jgi:hypothetical protein
VLSRRLKAVWLLALAFLATVLRRTFTRRKDGIRVFRTNYADDGLSPISPDQRKLLPTFGGCIACALCDRGESGRIAESGGAYSGVMSLMLAASRSMPDFAAAARSFACVPDTVLEEKERLCPTRVPMRSIAGFVRDKAKEARVSQPAPKPV